AGTATRTPWLSASSGSGSRWAASPSSPAPARQTSYRAPHGQVSTSRSSIPAPIGEPHEGHSSRYAYSVPRTEQTSTGTSPADAVTGRELGGPTSGNGTHSPPAAAGGPAPGPGAGRGPICSSFGSGGAVIPSTTTSVTSGAASCTAPSIASRTVTVEEGQPWQVPSSRSRATPSLTPRYCTPPACEPRYGRTPATAPPVR